MIDIGNDKGCISKIFIVATIDFNELKLLRPQTVTEG